MLPRQSVLDESVWGKSRGLDPALPPYPLVRHLLDAAAMALHLWDVYLVGNQRARIAEGVGLVGELDRARALVGLCAGLHDIGKLSGFQFCSRRAALFLSSDLTAGSERMSTERAGHDVAGMTAAAEVLEVLGFEDDEKTGAAERVAEIIGGHHGRFHLLENGVGPEFLGGALWAGQRAAHATAVHDALGAPAAPGSFEASAAVLVTGVVILADWLVSQEGYLRQRQRTLDPSLTDHFRRVQADAATLLRDAGLAPVELVRKDFAEAYGIAGEPNPLQQSVMDELLAAVGAGSRGGIMLVTAAPGDGKSEAALEAERILSKAFGTHGYAFLLPTMATSDQMHDRVARALSNQSGEDAGLTLVHSMAWLSRAYADEDLDGEAVVTCDGDEAPAGRRRREADMRPGRWLRGSKRPLLAQFAVGTIDQALMAVLPVRHNALRMLALSNKTFIVDEAHAYDPYMQVLLGRLLNWLGFYGVPVVLLSATLPRSVGDRLIKEYLRGAGHKPKALKGQSFPAPYPGWLYVDGETGRCAQISRDRQIQQARTRNMRLGVDVERVVHGGEGGVADRIAVIGRLLEPVARGDGGTALVVCNTVGDAQETYLRIREGIDGRSHEEGGVVQLLHARFPGDVREERTAEVTEGLGRSGPRPVRRIVVATQVVEQSLDLDADIVISDLAPLSLLLQRAGRCWRHENYWQRHGYPDGRGRPGWADGPRLVVLDPLVGGGRVPVQWGEVYSEHLLGRTSRKLAEVEGGGIAIPEDVQGLVEAVHGGGGDFDWDAPGGTREVKAWAEHTGMETAERSMAALRAVPRARQVRELHDLHSLEGEEDEWEVSTRLGADSVRLLCAYAQGDGLLTLDVAGTQPLPEADARARMPAASVRQVMRRTIPVRADWFRDAGPDALSPPSSWVEHPMLGDVRVLRQPVLRGESQAVKVGDKALSLDQDLGLVRF
ncbi:CRISPR-associated helicase Cas3' [Streptomyces sp. NPDC048445]|uniref:CRISPR-associated helicase Cas3' n=1 Tax=Streptomyces sp. NPDC048445 TaxID=3365553 RepID=UPI0037242083